MSLLMDALRRAEAEKKKAQKDAADDAAIEDDEDLAATVKLGDLPLPPISAGTSAADADTLDDTAPQTQFSGNPADGSPADRESSAEQFSIHAGVGPGDTAGGRRRLALEPLESERPAGDESGPSATRPDDAGLGDTDTTIPTPRSVQAQLDSYFDESQAAGVGPSPHDGPPDDAADELPPGQTAVNAYTVFEAGTPGVSGRIIAWALVVGAAFLGLLVVAGVYYFQQAPTTRNIPSPTVVNRLEVTPPAPVIEPTKPISSAAGSQPETAEAPPASPPEPMFTDGADATSTTPAAVDTTIEARNVTLTDTSRDADAVVEPGPADNDGETAARVDTVSDPVAVADSAGVVNVHAKSVRIARSERGAKTERLTSQAYTAYQDGKFVESKALYERALADRRDNTDALAGLAALALREGDVETAHRHYTRISVIDPENPIAAAALFQIEGGSGNRVTESQLKLMLDSGGDPGYINFALGNLYSRNGRWNDAQLAFFEAVRHRPTNPDYLYNLAVSLDQIGQHNAARSYYEQALTHSDDTKSSFDPSAVISRIQAIGSAPP